MGPIWGRQDPGGPHAGPINFAIWALLDCLISTRRLPILNYFHTKSALGILWPETARIIIACVTLFLQHFLWFQNAYLKQAWIVFYLFCIFPSWVVKSYLLHKKNICIACGSPDNKDHGANKGPTWVLSAPGGPHVGPMNLAIRGGLWFVQWWSAYFTFSPSYLEIWPMTLCKKKKNREPLPPLPCI